MTELLKQNIAAHISLSDTEMEAFCNLFGCKTIKKKSFLLREGEVCKFEGFVTKGLFGFIILTKMVLNKYFILLLKIGGLPIFLFIY